MLSKKFKSLIIAILLLLLVSIIFSENQQNQEPFAYCNADYCIQEGQTLEQINFK